MTIQSNVLFVDSSRASSLFAVAVACWLVNGFQHVPSFVMEHTEGDEQVYLCLAREMRWDLSNYTTKNDPVISQLPSPIYRGDLFHHPPLYPLVLKLGMLAGVPVLAGLAFTNLVIALTFFLTWRLMVRWNIETRWSLLAFLGLAFCPLLLFSTVKLHHDGLLGLLLASAVVVYTEALDRGSKTYALFASILFVAALNTRFSAMVALPLIPLLQLFHLHRRRTFSETDQSFSDQAKRVQNWIVFAMVMVLASTLGMHHYFRMLATYGTLSPSAITAAPEIAADFSPFLERVAHRGRVEIIRLLLCVFPFLVAFVTPWPYRVIQRSSRSGEWQSSFLLIFLYLLGMCLMFTHRQMRYFAVATPFLYLSLPHLFQQTTQRFSAMIGPGQILQVPYRPFLVAGVCATLLLMVTTGFYNSALQPPKHMLIIPSLFFYFPGLSKYLM